MYRTNRPAFRVLVLLGIATALLCPSIVNAEVPKSVLDQRQSVVSILVSGKEEDSNGTGFIIEPEGVIATNFHVVSAWLKEPDSSILVKLQNGAYFPVTDIIVYDERKDIALVKVDGRGLPALRLGGKPKAKVGQHVYVIGNPLGLQSTISDGIVSAIRADKLQITAPISPGSSGSPVFDRLGNILAIATEYVSEGQSLNFAIPIQRIVEARMEARKKKPIGGLWKTTDGSHVWCERKGQELKIYTRDVSTKAFQMGYDKGEIVFAGIVRGDRIAGLFVARNKRFEKCYPDGKPLNAKGRINFYGDSIQLEVQDILIDGSRCAEVRESGIILINMVR